VPALSVTHRPQREGEGHRTVVEVKPAHLPGPVPLELALTHGAGRDVHTVHLPPEGGRWTFETPTPTRRVEANADRGLLARVND
jgi:hypothetical protein